MNREKIQQVFEKYIASCTPANQKKITAHLDEYVDNAVQVTEILDIDWNTVYASKSGNVMIYEIPEIGLWTTEDVETAKAGNLYIQLRRYKISKRNIEDSIIVKLAENMMIDVTEKISHEQFREIYTETFNHTTNLTTFSLT